jgi:diacylglycerol kinase (ATP)
LSGTIGKSKLVTVKSIKKVKITVAGNESLSTNVDGDRGPELPLEIEILPSYLQVYAPCKSYQ